MPLSSVLKIPNNIKLQTIQLSTSGTLIDFNLIPVGVKKITLMLNGVSTNGTSGVQLRIGSGSIATSGYTGSTSLLVNPNFVSVTTPTNGFNLGTYAVATTFLNSVISLNLMDGNTWMASMNGSYYTQNVTTQGTGSVTLSGVLDRLRITTINGTDVFDAGSVNISWEF